MRQIVGVRCDSGGIWWCIHCIVEAYDGAATPLYETADARIIRGPPFPGESPHTMKIIQLFLKNLPLKKTFRLQKEFLPGNIDLYLCRPGWPSDEHARRLCQISVSRLMATKRDFGAELRFDNNSPQLISWSGSICHFLAAVDFVFLEMSQIRWKQVLSSVTNHVSNISPRTAPERSRPALGGTSRMRHFFSSHELLPLSTDHGFFLESRPASCVFFLAPPRALYTILLENSSIDVY